MDGMKQQTQTLPRLWSPEVWALRPALQGRTCFVWLLASALWSLCSWPRQAVQSVWVSPPASVLRKTLIAGSGSDQATSDDPLVWASLTEFCLRRPFPYRGSLAGLGDVDILFQEPAISRTIQMSPVLAQCGSSLDVLR